MARLLLILLGLPLLPACSRPAAAAGPSKASSPPAVEPPEDLEVFPVDIERFPIADRATWEAELPPALIEEFDSRVAAKRQWADECYWNKADAILRLRAGDAITYLVPMPMAASGPGAEPGSAFLFREGEAPGSIIAEPLALDRKWLKPDPPGNGFDPRAVDLDGDGQLELDLHQFEHNGTVVNIDHRVLIDLSSGLPPREVLRYAAHNAETPFKRKWGDIDGDLLRLPSGDLLLRRTWVPYEDGETTVLSRSRLTQDPDATWKETQRVDYFPRVAFTLSWPIED